MQLRKQSNITFAYSNDILENIVANMPGHVYWKDKEGVYLGCNDKQAKSLGLNHGGDVVGKTDYELPWSKKDAQKFRENDLHIMQSGKTEFFEEQSIVDGKPATVLSLKSPLRNKQTNEIIGVMGISIDITRQKEAENALLLEKEKAEAANAAKTIFLLDMRHDIRTPLSGMIGLANLLQAHSEEPLKVREFAKDFVSASEALLVYLNKILEAIKTTSGDVAVLKEKFNLKKTLEEIAALMRPQAKLKNIDIQLLYSKELPEYFISDEQRIYRIVLELVSNALKFTQQGFVKISASLATETKKEHHIVLRLQVEDSGAGVPEELHKEIFTRFKKSSPSYKGGQKGLGLGLSVIKEHIDMLEGEIYLNKTKKDGAEFTCLIPLQIALLQNDDGCDSHKEANKNSREESLKTATDEERKITNKGKVKSPKEEKLSSTENEATIKPRVLLVEDDLLIRMVTVNLLTTHGCEVDEAGSGEEALELAKKNQYDIVFMDLGLPGMDGCATTQALRAEKFEMPILALSAHGDEEHRQQCLEAGMNALVNKANFTQDAKSVLTTWCKKRDTGE